jgi:YidC/Oxa1 family membrane protein insertase
MMDWRTILAVAISVVLIIAVPLLLPVIFPGQKAAPATTTSTTTPGTPSAATGQPAASAPQATAPPAATQATAAPATTAAAPAATAAAPGGTGKVEDDPAGIKPAPGQPARIVRETDKMIIAFETAGAEVSSIKLKDFRNLDGSPVELVLANGSSEQPFALAFGDYQAAPEKGPFVLREYAEGARRMFEFSKSKLSATGVPFTLKKTYVLMDGEHLIELRVAIENSANDVPAIDSAGVSYTLTVGPQIGPTFKKLDNRTDFRYFVYWWLNDKGNLERKKEAASNNRTKTLDRPVTWAGVIGKYFTVIAVPPGDQAHLVLDARQLVPGTVRSSLAFSRPTVRASRTEDVWRFYLGPMKTEVMDRYNKSEDNGFGIRDLRLSEAIDKPWALLRPIILVLRWLLEMFVKLIPNWGVAIILVTLVTKIVFLPLTFKSSESMARMAALNPKIQEIRTRLKDKPEKMNQEMAELYRKEKINPLSGCLPLLLQIPIFFALYNLLNTQFELRGAPFIPGWIPDLSVAESVYDLPFTIPWVNIDAIRVLPLIMLGTQILSSKVMQPASGNTSGNQMKLLNYAMPVMFLFFLYNMPSGLTLYWTVQNILSVIQQVYINWRKGRKPTTPVPAKA